MVSIRLSQHICHKPSVLPAVCSEDGHTFLSFASACVLAHRVSLSTGFSWNTPLKLGFCCPAGADTHNCCQTEQPCLHQAAFSLRAFRPSIMCCRCGLELTCEAKQRLSHADDVRGAFSLSFRLSTHRGSSSSLLKFKFHPSLFRPSLFSPLCV